jgi:DNA-binding NarL/FixJ family response regulator
MPSKPRVLIADDHLLIAELCKKYLENEFEVLGPVTNGRAMVRAAKEEKPQAIIVDIAMPVLNGLDAGQQVKAAQRGIKLVYLTMNPDPQLAAEAFRRGASGYVLKTCAASELPTAVRAVLNGRSYISSGLPKHAIEDLVRRDEKWTNHRLTEREREVLQLLAEGKQMKEVAAILQIATRTVAFHKYRMMEVLDAKSNAELIRHAVRLHTVAA